jgi:hypothetical protein
MGGMDDDVRCPHGLRLPPLLLAELRQIPFGGYDLTDVTQAWCYLAAGHSGLHHWQGQGSAVGFHWVRWSDDVAAELVVLPLCEALPPDDPDGEDWCGLFAGHDGIHDYY